MPMATVMVTAIIVETGATIMVAMALLMVLLMAPLMVLRLFLMDMAQLQLHRLLLPLLPRRLLRAHQHRSMVACRLMATAPPGELRRLHLMAMQHHGHQCSLLHRRHQQPSNGLAGSG